MLLTLKLAQGLCKLLTIKLVIGPVLRCGVTEKTDMLLFHLVKLSRLQDFSQSLKVKGYAACDFKCGY